MSETSTLQDDLRQFTGTETWYRHPFSPMLYTDGVKYFADQAGAYWFLDIVATEVWELISEDDPYLFVTLMVRENQAVIAADDGNGNTSWSRDIEFTDCPEGDWKFYLFDGVLLLPGEY
jgi:hypothetical protein